MSVHRVGDCRLAVFIMTFRIVAETLVTFPLIFTSQSEFQARKKKKTFEIGCIVTYVTATFGTFHDSFI